MPEPKSEQIILALIDVLEAMTGDHAPKRVVREPVFHGGVLDPTFDVIYSVSPGEPRETRHAFGTVNNVGFDLGIGLALCKRFRGLDNELDVTRRWAEQNRLIKAAGDAIRADRQLGGLALDLVLDDWDISANDTYVDKWAIAFMRFTISYLHSEVAA